MDQVIVEHSERQVLLRFKSTEGNTPLLLTDSEIPGNRFRCDEIRAEFTLSAKPEISLYGVLDERVPYVGTIRQNSKSEKELLSYLLQTLELKGEEHQNKEIKETSSKIRDILNSIEYQISVTAHSLKDLLEVNSRDLTWVRSRSKKRAVEKNTKERNTQKKSLQGNTETEAERDKERSNDIAITSKFSIFTTEDESFSLPYESVSGFLAIEVSEKFEDHIAKQSLEEIAPLAERLSFMAAAAMYGFTEEGTSLQVPLICNDSLDDLSFFYHIGNRDNKSEAWTDYEAQLIGTKGQGTYLRLSLESFNPGRYEYTCYAVSRYSNETLWMSPYGQNNTFVIGSVISTENAHEGKGRKETAIPLGSYDAFSRWCKKKREEKHTGALLEDLLEKEESRKILSAYYEEALRRLSKRKSSSAQAVVRMFRTLGLSSIVMVTPEGPHAIAGGLAQVIVGLSEVFSNEGLEVTLVTPLYEEACGNHHASFLNAQSEGLMLFGERVIPERKQDIQINIPATFWSNNHGTATPRRVLKIEVYEAKCRNIRILFLRHKTLGDRLYGGISAKDQLLRSVFLSRGAIELCRHSSYEIDPGVIISHDWLTALITPLLELDPVYADDEKLKQFTPIHMLHNVGKAYQGTFPISEQGEVLWPLLGLPMEHIFGFLDESTPDHMNMTKGACFHNSSAIVTVSKPYADQLLDENSGEGLSHILRQKKDILYGISNGIPQDSVRKAGFYRVSSEEKTSLPLTENILNCKSKLKSLIQAENGLEINDEAILGVFVGRLTEQKGLGLLSAQLDTGLSVIEDILETVPTFQILVAGPPSYFDQSFIEFERYYSYLQAKYPGRCARKFEFVPHKYAIEYTAAADLFLMPSLYEPGGITQLEALAVGTTVVAHRVGGLSATLSPFKLTSGNSFLFESFSQEAFRDSLQAACRILSDLDGKKLLVERTISARNGWEHRVPYYLSLFQKTLGIFDVFSSAASTFSSNRLDLLSRISAD